MSKTKYVDICIQPIPKKHLAKYRQTTKMVGKLLLKHGALASRDYVGDDKNATILSFPKAVKMKKGEVVIYALAEFKSKAHRDKVFKTMSEDPQMNKIMEMDPGMMDQKRAVVGGFSLLVEVE